MQALLLKEIKNPIIRSAVINYVLSVLVAVGVVIQAEVTNGKIDFTAIGAAVTLASLKWLHSTATDLSNRATTFDTKAELARLNAEVAATAKPSVVPPSADSTSPPQP